MDIDACRIMHDVSIVISRKNVTCATHVGGKLIHFVKETDLSREKLFAHLPVSQITDDERICSGLAEFRLLEINPFDPIPFFLEPPD